MKRSIVFHILVLFSFIQIFSLMNISYSVTAETKNPTYEKKVIENQTDNTQTIIYIFTGPTSTKGPGDILNPQDPEKPWLGCCDNCSSVTCSGCSSGPVVIDCKPEGLAKCETKDDVSTCKPLKPLNPN